MGLFDFLNGQGGDPNQPPDPGQQYGAPAPQYGAPQLPAQGGGLLDMIGSHLAGGNGTIDPRLAQQLGIDPRAMQHQAAMSALGNFGQAMLAASTTRGLGRPSFNSALAAGLGAAQNGPNPMEDAVKQALASRTLAKEDAETQQRQAKMQQLAQFQKAIGSVQLPPELQPMQDAMQYMDPGQAVTMMDNAFSNKAKAEHDDKQNAAAADRQQAQLEQQMRVQQIISDRQNATQLAIADRANAAANRLPAEWNLLTPEQQKAAAMAKLMPEPKPTAQDTAIAKQTAVRLQKITSAIPVIDSALSQAQTMKDGFQGGVLDTGNPVMRRYNSLAPGALRSDSANLLDAQSSQLVTDAMAAYAAANAAGGGRGNMLQLRTALASKPGVSVSNDTAQSILGDNIIGPLQAQREELAREADHYNSGGNISTWSASLGKQGPPGSSAAGRAPPEGSVVYRNGQKYIVQNGVPVPAQ